MYQTLSQTMQIVIGRKEITFSLDRNNGRYTIFIKNLNTHQVWSGGNISKEYYFGLIEHIEDLIDKDTV